MLDPNDQKEKHSFTKTPEKTSTTVEEA